MATRAVAWPHDIAVLARSLARADNWFWLDGEAADPDGRRGLSYLGQSADVIHAIVGEEHQFLAVLRGELADADGQAAVSLHHESCESCESCERNTPDKGHQCQEPRAVITPALIVAFSYEFGVALMGQTPAADDREPAFALRTSTVLVLDHASQTAELRAPSEAHLDAWLVQHAEALVAATRTAGSGRCRGTHSMPSHARTARGDAVRSDAAQASWRCSDAEYLDQIEACKNAIRDGEAYVLCLTDLAEQPAAGVHPLELYAVLRESGAATRGAVMVAGDRALVSVSPERFLSVRGRTITTHPIKGTRPRHPRADLDHELASELACDPKERAENLMIVDLMRNDFSRVCEPESIATGGFLRVESHAQVHQLVSTVTGSLRDGLDAIDALRMTFPGGSMTGAPKTRAVQLLAGLERGARGLYSGCFGWIARESAELAMSIRCIELRGVGAEAAVARIGAGGGITSDSDPVAELAEKHLKAAPLLAAIELVQSE